MTAELPAGSLFLLAGPAGCSSFCPKVTHLPLCPQSLGVGGLPEALHAHGVQLHHALRQRHQVQDAPKGLSQTAGKMLLGGLHEGPKAAAVPK